MVLLRSCLLALFFQLDMLNKCIGIWASYIERNFNRNRRTNYIFNFFCLPPSNWLWSWLLTTAFQNRCMVENVCGVACFVVVVVVVVVFLIYCTRWTNVLINTLDDTGFIAGSDSIFQGCWICATRRIKQTWTKWHLSRIMLNMLWNL